MAYKNIYKWTLLVTALTFWLAVFADTVRAQDVTEETTQRGNVGKTYTLLEPLPCIPYEETVYDENGQPMLGRDGKVITIPHPCDGATIKEMDLGNFFQYTFNLLIALSAAAAVFMMVYGGFLYTATASSTKKSEGLDKFKNAVIGLLMVIGAFLIMRTVNPQLVEIPTSVPAVRVPENLRESPSDILERVDRDVRSMLNDVHVQQTQGSREAIEKSIQNIDSLTKEYDDLESQLSYPGLSDADIAAIEEELLAIEMEITEENANAVVARSSARIANVWQSATTGGTSQGYIDLMRDKINTEYESGIANLEKVMDNPISQKENLENMKKFSNAALDIQSALLSFEKGSSGNSIKSKIDTMSNDFVGAVSQALVQGVFGVGSLLTVGNIAPKVSASLDASTQQKLYSDLSDASKKAMVKYNITDPLIKKQLENVVESIVNKPQK